MVVATEISNIILAKTTILGIFLISRKMYSSVHLPIIFLESLCFTFPLFLLRLDEFYLIKIYNIIYFESR